MSALVLYLHHPSVAGLVLLFVILCCRPRALAELIDSVALLVAVLVGLVARDAEESRPKRAIAIVEALADGGKRRVHVKEGERKQLELPPGPPK